jgi:hypothetical protein
MTKDEIEKQVYEKYPYDPKESWCWTRKDYLEGKREMLRKRLYDEAAVQRQAFETDEQAGENVHS